MASTLIPVSDWTTPETQEPLTSSNNGGPVLSCSWADNGPNWTRAWSTLNYGYDIHVYFFASCYVVIVCYAITTIVRTIMQRQGRKRLGISLHVMIAMASFTRALSLFADPYGSRGWLPCPLSVIVWSLGWPGIISSYSIFFLSALETTKLSIASPRFQRLSTLFAIIGVSIAYVLFADLLVSYFTSAIISILICELMFIIWGMILTTGFVYVWWRVRENLSASCPRNDRERRRSSMHGSVYAANSEVQRLNRLITMFIVSAFVCLFLTLTHLTPVIGMFEQDIVDFSSRPWQWLAFHTGQRTLEVIMCFLIMIVMLKSPSSNNRADSYGEKVVP